MNGAGVREALERILASPGSTLRARNRRFLEYIVEETLAGRADRLKGLTIAIDVFGRDAATFDAQHDPVVRIQAAKLRRRLERYYLTAGQQDPIRIDIPKGTYVPIFERRGHLSPDSSRPRPANPPRRCCSLRRPATRGRAGIGSRPPSSPFRFWGALGWLGTDLLASRLRSDGSQDAATTLPRGPKIAVLPFVNLSGDPEQAYFAAGVTDQIVTDLARFKALFVLSTESTAKYQEQSADPQRLKRELGVDYRSGWQRST